VEQALAFDNTEIWWTTLLPRPEVAEHLSAITEERHAVLPSLGDERIVRKDRFAHVQQAGAGGFFQLFVELIKISAHAAQRSRGNATILGFNFTPW